VVGSCTRLGYQHLIKLDTLNSLWVLSGNLGKEEIIFHELGHCLLDRPHKDDKFVSGDFASIMRTIGLLQYGDLNNFTRLLFGLGPVGLKAHRRDYYIDELFGQTVVTPCWSDSTITSPFPLTIFEDDIVKNREFRNLWLDAEDNLWLYGNEKNFLYSSGIFKNVLPVMEIRAMNNDGQGNLWITAVQEQQAIVGTYRRGEFKIKYTVDSIPGTFQTIDQILVDDLDRIWISDNTGNLYANTGDGFKLVVTTSQNRVFNMKQGPNHSVYMLRGGNLHIFDDPKTYSQLSRENSDLTTDFFRDLEVDKDGVAWLLPSGSAAYLLQLTPDHQVNRLDFYNINLAELRVNAIETDPLGDIWAATSNGIKKWEGNSFSNYCRYNTGVGVLTFSRIVVGNDGRIWSLGRDQKNLEQRLMLSEPGL